MIYLRTLVDKVFIYDIKTAIQLNLCKLSIAYFGKHLVSIYRPFCLLINPFVSANKENGAILSLADWRKIGA